MKNMNVVILSKNNLDEAKFTYEAIKIIYKNNIVINPKENIPNEKNITFYETEYLNDLLEEGHSIDKIIYNPKRSVIVELSDCSKINSLDDDVLINIVDSCICMIKREPDLNCLEKRGYNIKKIIPTIFGWVSIKKHDMKHSLLKPFFFGGLTSSLRYQWLNKLIEKYESEYLRLYKYEGLGLSENINLNLNHSILLNENMFLDRNTYISKIQNLFFGVCLRGIGELTARHVENWESGKLVFSDSSISFLNNELIHPVHLQNCILADSCEELLEFIEYFSINHTLAKKIADEGMCMIENMTKPINLARKLMKILPN
jgi:hypothetical protein